MKILIVDNHTKHQKEWVKLIAPYNIVPEFVKAEELVFSETDQFDLVILSGGVGFAVDRNIEAFQKEFELIRNRQKPLLGVCLGFEAIIIALGGELLYRTERVVGTEENQVSVKDSIFAGRDYFISYVAHKYYALDVPENCEILARSEHGVEVFRHTQKPLYGFQFHPETVEPKNDGAELFENFMKEICGMRKSSA